MQDRNTNPLQNPRWFYLFIFAHLFLWTCVPFFVRHNLPMDSIEGAIWGHQLQWGYDKNPFLNGWLTALAVKLTGTSGFAIYLFSQLSVVICFWAVWRLARKMLPGTYALLAVMLLEGVQYYNFHAIDFNDNTLELSLWALTSLYFYQALKNQSVRNWLLTGIFAGLGMMTKYYTIVLLLPMLLFMLKDHEQRASFKKPAPYYGLAACVLIMVPHIVWLFFHDFVTVNYALFRVHARPSLMNHFYFPATFGWQQIQAFLPALALLFVFFMGKKPWLKQSRHTLVTFDKQFLLYVGLGPLLLTLVLSAIMGIRLRAGWGEPLISLWGIMFFAYVQPYLNDLRSYRFIAIFYSLLTLIVASYGIALLRGEEPSSANYPGERIARALTADWYRTYHQPLKYVAGSRWVAGNIAFYSKDHPSVLINWDPKVSPWINLAKLQKSGAIFVWDMSEEMEKTPQQVIPQYAKLGEFRIIHFTWLRNKNLKPVEIGVAFLPPVQE